VTRGLKTLALRMERHCENALAIAHWLERQPKIEKVFYPGSRAIRSGTREAADGRGRRMVSAIVKGGESAALRFLERCEIFTLAESLGGVESLIEHPAIMTHASVPAEVRGEIGISDALVRLLLQRLLDFRDQVRDVLPSHRKPHERVA